MEVRAVERDLDIHLVFLRKLLGQFESVTDVLLFRMRRTELNETRRDLHPPDDAGDMGLYFISLPRHVEQRFHISLDRVYPRSLHSQGPLLQSLRSVLVYSLLDPIQHLLDPIIHKAGLHLAE